jgi:AI-2E family transporter
MVAAAAPLQRPSLPSLPDDDLPKPPAADGGRRRDADAAAFRSADVLSRWFVRIGCLGGALRSKLDHPSRRIRLRVESPSSTRCPSLGTFASTPYSWSLLTVSLVIGALVGLVAALSVPAATWAERLPEGIPRLEAHLEVIKGPIQALQKVIQQAEQAADAPPGRGSIVSVRRDLGITGALFAGTRSVLDGLFTTVLVLYCLLVAGDIFLRRIVEILPTFSNKRQAVDISQQIQEDISGYLVTITAMNAAVGVTTAAAMYLCGLGDPLLWGTTAFLLNYIPILGPLSGSASSCWSEC